MNKHITVGYDVNNLPGAVELCYDVQMEDNVQTIYCQVTDNDIPTWLRLRKFELRSLMINEGYIQLFSDNVQISTVDAEQFMDKAYAAIMKQEAYVLI